MKTLIAAAAVCSLALAAGPSTYAGTPGAGIDSGVVVAKAPKKDKGAKPQPKKDKAEGKGDAAKPPEEGVAKEGAAEGVKAGAEGAGGGPLLQRSNRLEFDARLIQGQLAKSGAIFLFERAPRALPPLLKLKRSYVREIVDSELGADYLKQQK